MYSIAICGFNGFGQVVFSSSVEENDNRHDLVYETVSTPVFINVPDVGKSMTDNCVRHIVFSWNRVYIVLNDNSVVTTETLLDVKPYRLKHFGIQHVCCGWKDTFWITVDGQCHYCEQHNEFKSPETGSKFEKQQLQNSDKLTQLETGASFTDCDEHPDTFCNIQTNNSTTIALTTAGMAFTIELENTRMSFFPIVIHENRRIQSVTCGKHHTILLTDTGSVYSFGTGSHGELGHSTVDSEVVPRRIEILDGVTITDISAGGWHSVALGSCGEVYVWGWNERGQLGLPCSALRNATGRSNDSIDNIEVVNIQTVPQLLEFFIPESLSSDVSGMKQDDTVTVTKLACGSRHTVALTEDGFAFSWGWNEYGQLGHGDTIDRDQPSMMEQFVRDRQRVTDVFAGNWNSAFVLKHETRLGIHIVAEIDVLK